MKRLQLAAGTTFVGAWLMSYRAGHGSSAEDVQALFKLLNNLDTVKIVLLAIMIAAASLLARQRRLPGLARDRRPRTGGASALSGLAFPLDSDALYAVLAVT